MLDIDARIAGLASTQFGVVSRDQLTELGCSSRMISLRVERGLLVRLHRRVYALPGVQPSWRRALMAAQLHLGPRSVMSHRSAARYWGLDGIDRDLVEFSVVGDRRPSPGIKAHRAGSLGRQDVRFLTPFRITKVERTLIDLGAVVNPDRVEEALESALFHRLTTLRRLEQRLEALRRPGMRGIVALDTVLKRRDSRLRPTESIFETRFFRMLRQSPLPPPVRQYRVFDEQGFVARVDLAWPSARVGIEALSLRWHSASRRRAYDARRDNRLKTLGWVVLEELYEDLNRRPEEILERVRRLLQSGLWDRTNLTGS